MEQKERIPQLDVFRALAIGAVLTIHATSRTLAETEGTGMFHLFLFINKISQFAVPSFIFLSGFVLFYNYIDRPLTRRTVTNFYGRRLMYIVVPYVVFSVFYYLIKLYAGNGWSTPLPQMAGKLFHYLWTGTAYTHLYYVIIIIQFYVLFPPLLALLKRSRTLAAWSPLLGLALQWGFIVLNKYMTINGHWQISKGSIALSYFAYFLLGAGIAVHYSKLKAWLIPHLAGWKSGKGAFWAGLWVIWAAAGITYVELWHAYYMKQPWVSNSLWYEALGIFHALLTCIVLLQLSFMLYGQGKGRMVWALSHIGVCSFGIYLVHPAVLYVYRMLPFSGGPPAYIAQIAGGWLAALLISWFVTGAVMRLLPGISWIFFGSSPKKPAQAAVVDGRGQR